jgi:hypothetical protein
VDDPAGEVILDGADLRDGNPLLIDDGLLHEADEQALRRAAQAEHGEATIARHEADGEHAAGDISVTPTATRRAGYLPFKCGFSRFQYG